MYFKIVDKYDRDMKKLAITMGDPGGVGPEIIVKALNSPEVKNLSVPVVIGDASVIEEALKLCKIPLSLRIIRSPEEAFATEGLINFIHVIPPTPPFFDTRADSLRRNKSGGRKNPKLKLSRRTNLLQRVAGGSFFCIHT